MPSFSIADILLLQFIVTPTLLNVGYWLLVVEENWFGGKRTRTHRTQSGNRSLWVFHNGFLKNLKKTPEKNRENNRCSDKKIQKLKYESRPRKMSLDAIMMRVMMRWDWLQSQKVLGLITL